VGPSIAEPLPTREKTYTRGHTSVPRGGFELAIPMI